MAERSEVILRSLKKFHPALVAHSRPQKTPNPVIMRKPTDKDMLQKQPFPEPDTVDNLTSTKATNRLAKLLNLGKGKTYDPSIIIPKISEERLQAAAHDHALDINTLLHDHGPKAKHSSEAKTSGPDVEAHKPEETVLYLAYGSNMSAQSFRKTRGILPVSQLNVYVPGLSLTFDLPGFPYVEPCMAGTKYRDDNQAPIHRSDQTWDKPLVGVVYEVTLSDYARIIATEGGGSSYIDIVTDCYPFPKSYDPADPVPTHPLQDAKPFKAHTLLYPSHKNEPDNTTVSPLGNAKENAHATNPPPCNKPYTRVHPANAPAQPSPRYKNLLVTGAREHDLPAEYCAYLSSITTYRVTTTRQQIGRYTTVTLWAPPVILVMMLSSLTTDKNGRAPRWVVATQKFLVVGLWGWYDHFAKRIFGDGERVIEA
ncbi:gliotoxin biosynthesis protein GliK [Histoplasma capsulatum]|uniref:gamma-glutamylcyclotransferase n=1 Tax=Ajellomyces capsulatus TaxID=5037 RepID=A0A8A1M4M7_AJECA|nr:gliotoxin biosynthesis protein GliK [Histoplasma capsulatum]